MLKLLKCKKDKPIGVDFQLKVKFEQYGFAINLNSKTAAKLGCFIIGTPMEKEL